MLDVFVLLLSSLILLWFWCCRCRGYCFVVGEGVVVLVVVVGSFSLLGCCRLL